MSTWRDRAACRGLPLGIFFSSVPADVNTARQICRTCKVRTNCLEYIEEIERGMPAKAYGTYAGLTDRERRAKYAQLKEQKDLS